MANNGMKRRDFFGKAAAGLVTTGLSLPLLNAGTTEQKELNKFVYRTLGRTKLRIPIVSFGVMNSDSPDLLNRALDAGVNHLDTAHGYLRGNSERVIGEVLERRGGRDKVYVATKMYFARDREKGEFIKESGQQGFGATEEEFFKQLEISLKRLRTDYVDILYLHSLYTPKMVTYEPMMNALVKAKKQGKARFIGTTTHHDESNIIRSTVDAEIYDVVLTVYNFVHEKREEIKKSIQYAVDKGVGVVAMKTQGGRRYQEESKEEINHLAALKWVLNDENVCTTIPGMTAFEQLDLNLKAMSDIALSQKEKEDLRMVAGRKGLLFCQNCRSCVSSCPSRVEIPDLMRSYMYARSYGNYFQARITVAELPSQRGLDVCRTCSSCSADCVNGINIASRMQSLIEDKLYMG